MSSITESEISSADIGGYDFFVLIANAIPPGKELLLEVQRATFPGRRGVTSRDGPKTVLFISTEENYSDELAWRLRHALKQRLGTRAASLADAEAVPA